VRGEGVLVEVGERPGDGEEQARTGGRRVDGLSNDRIALSARTDRLGVLDLTLTDAGYAVRSD
jgi:hypothetical protein